MDTYAWTPTVPYFVGSLTPMAVQFTPVFPTTPFSTFFPQTPAEETSGSGPGPVPSQLPPQLPRPVSQPRGLQPIQLANGSLQLGSVLNSAQFMAMLSISPEQNRFKTVNPASTMRSSYVPAFLPTSPPRGAPAVPQGVTPAVTQKNFGSGSAGSAGSVQSTQSSISRTSQSSAPSSQSSVQSSQGSCMLPASPPPSSPSSIRGLYERVPLLEPVPGSSVRPTPRKRAPPAARRIKLEDDDEDDEYVPNASPSSNKVRAPGRPMKRRKFAASLGRPKTQVTASVPGFDLGSVDMSSEQAVLNACLGQSQLDDPIKVANGWLCPECKKEYKHYKHARRHMLAHLGIKPHTCDLCDSTFARRDTMHRHRERCKKSRR